MYSDAVPPRLILLPSNAVTQLGAVPDDSDPGLLERATGLPTWALVAGLFVLGGLLLLPKVEPGFHAARRIARGREREDE